MAFKKARLSLPPPPANGSTSYQNPLQAATQQRSCFISSARTALVVGRTCPTRPVSEKYGKAIGLDEPPRGHHADEGQGEPEAVGEAHKDPELKAGEGLVALVYHERKKVDAGPVELLPEGGHAQDPE